MDWTSIVLGLLTLVGGCGWVVNHRKYKQEVKHLEAENRQIVNGNCECSIFGKTECSVFRNSSTSFSVTMMQHFS